MIESEKMNRTLRSRLISKAREILSVDKRSLALFRVLVAMSTLFDVIDRSRDLSAHYTVLLWWHWYTLIYIQDSGILSRSVVLANFHNSYWVSVYMLTGTTFGVACLFLLHATFAFLMMIGYRTRVMTFLTWFFVISIQDRNYVLGHGGTALTVYECNAI